MIKKLLEIYRTFPNRDPIMERFAEGKLAAITENYTLAIEHYREILAKNPNLNPVRIELAIALFNQKQDGAAKDQFEKAQTAEDLPPQVKRLIDAYLEALKERDSWNLDFSFNYVRDTNVNNVGSERKWWCTDSFRINVATNSTRLSVLTRYFQRFQFMAFSLPHGGQ